MRRALLFILACGLATSTIGCASKSQTAPAQAPAAAAVAIAPKAMVGGNPLSQVANGMTKKQVRDLAGPPSDENSYATGKAWIPWYFGNDTRRTSWYYKGQGQVIFADGNVFGGGGGGDVVEVHVDASETGVAR